MPSLLVTARELKEERATLITQNREIIDKAEKEKRTFTAEEQTTYDTRFAKVEELGKRATLLEKQAELEDGLTQRGEPAKPDATKPQSTEVRVYKPESRHAHLGIRRDYNITNDEAVESRLMAQLRRFILGDMATNLSPVEKRHLQMDVDELGGYTVPPQKFVAELLQAVDDLTVVRQFATVHQLIQAESLGVPSLDADPADADWTTELATGSEDSSMRFGKRELRPHPLAKRIKVSKKLLRASPLNVEAIVRDRLAYKFAVTEEKAFLTGDGVQKPLGLFTASTNGISTARDVSTDNTATSVTYDGIKNAKWFLKAAYWPRARWIFHRDLGKQIDKLKDGDGRYIWRPSIQAGVPDTLENFPMHLDEYAPSTFTTGQYVAILGDLSFYWIVDALSFELQKLVELYAETNQVGFIGRLETDGMPMLEEAFVRVKLG
jgi:HK97 family phage major capsid protein